MPSKSNALAGAHEFSGVRQRSHLLEPWPDQIIRLVLIVAQFRGQQFQQQHVV